MDLHFARHTFRYSRRDSSSLAQNEYVALLHYLGTLPQFSARGRPSDEAFCLPHRFFAEYPR
jgi:hypothetical protein